MEEEFAHGGCCVDAFAEGLKAYASLSEVVEEVYEVWEGSSEAVDADDYEGVAFAKSAAAFDPLGSFHGGAAGMFCVDRVASCGPECVDLGGEVLVVGADSGVSGDAHNQNHT